MSEELHADTHLTIQTPFGKVEIQPGDTYMLDENRLDQVKREVTGKDGTIISLYANFTLTQVPPLEE